MDPVGEQKLAVFALFAKKLVSDSLLLRSFRPLQSSSLGLLEPAGESRCI